MRKKTKMAWSVAHFGRNGSWTACRCGSNEERKVRVEALQQVLPRQNLLPAIQQIPVTAQPTKLQR